MRIATVTSMIALLAAGITSVTHAQLPADSGAYVVRLGRDTLKIERFVKRDNVIRSESVRRGEGVEEQHVDMIFDSEGYLASAQVRTYKWPVEPGAIISSQTGQWGTEHDPAQDFARIPIRTRSLTSPVEQLTIGIEPRTRGGVLRIQWDTTEAYAEFGVR
jgi:hypothetical protein